MAGFFHWRPWGQSSSIPLAMSRNPIRGNRFHAVHPHVADQYRAEILRPFPPSE